MDKLGSILHYQVIPGESPKTILANISTVGDSGERTSQMMFYVSQRLMTSFSGGFLSSLSGPDLEYLIEILIFTLFTFTYIPAKQCPSPLGIPMI